MARLAARWFYLQRSGIEVVDGRTGFGHKADHTTAALLRDRVQQLTITGAVEIVVPKGAHHLRTPSKISRGSTRTNERSV